MSEYTTEKILKLIERNGGPKGLDLSGEDLMGINLGWEEIAKELKKAREGAPDETPVWYSAWTWGKQTSKGPSWECKPPFGQPAGRKPPRSQAGRCKPPKGRAGEGKAKVGRLGDHQHARHNNQRVERSGLPPGRRLRPAVQHEQYQAYPQGTEQYQRPGDKAAGHEAVVGIS